jgi:hypothetical protein
MGTEGNANGSNSEAGANGNSGAADGSGNSGSAGAGSQSAVYDAKFDLSQHVPEALRTEPYFASFKGKTIGDVIKSGVEAHKLVGSSVRIPGPDAKPEEYEAFDAKLRPETPEKYSYTLKDEKFKEVYSERIKGFNKVFYDNGVTDRAAKAIIAAYEDDVLATARNMETGMQADVTNGDLKLKAKYGQGYDRAAVMATRAAKRFGGDAFVQLIKDYNLHTDPVFFDAMYGVAQAIHEDSFVKGEAPPIMLTKEAAKSKVDAILADTKNPYHHESDPNHGAVSEYVRQLRKIVYAEQNG